MEQIENTENTQPKNSKNKRLLIVGVLVVIALSVLGWMYFRNDSKGKEDQAKVSYVTNNHDILCVTNGSDGLECENLKSGEVKDFILPKKYKFVQSILPSPDSSKLLLRTNNQDIEVTDLDFKPLYKVFSAEELKDRYPTFAWAGNDQLLIKEIKYEENDTRENPPPLIIYSYDLETKEEKRIYKTGEKVDIESIKLIGASDQYLYISLPSAKNWVAQKTNSPIESINAIRLSDGFVRQVNSYQIDVTGNEATPVEFRDIYYDTQNNRLLIVARKDGSPNSGVFMVAQILENEYGLVTEKLHDMPVETTFNQYPILTSKGILSDKWDEASSSYSLIDDQGNRTELKIKPIDAYVSVFSLESMPDLKEDK